MITLKDARKRNLIMKVTNAYVRGQFDINMQFKSEEIQEKLYFKNSDIVNYMDDIFENGLVKHDIKEKIEKYAKLHNEYKGYKEEEEFKRLYSSLERYFINNSKNGELYTEDMSQAVIIAEKLHWKYLPIYFEQFICNREIIPEDDLSEFYNHFHAIEDLYRYIFTDDKIDWKSLDGDINLNKRLKLRVYTTRWGNNDYYSIMRTIDGWEVDHLTANNGKCKKNGEGSLINKLNHDSVCYPEEGLKYALEVLWEEADTTSMTIEELQKKLDDISLWIEKVEIATHQYQPEWCGYY